MIATPGLPPVLQLDAIAKSFGGARALQNISFAVDAGEIHGLLGKNGSGKSTLVKILAGFHAPDPGGRMSFNGAAVPLPLKPGTFRSLGMGFVHQNLGLVPSLSVLENFRIKDLTTPRRSFIDWRRERAITREAFERLDIDLDPAWRVDRLSPVEKVQLAIARAFEEVESTRRVTGQPGLLLLDEPTPFLGRVDVEKLFRLMRSIARNGSSVIFISHDIEEIQTITDRVTVLRDGILSGTRRTAGTAHEDIVEMIVGRRVPALPRPQGVKTAEPVRFRFENMAAGMLQPTSIQVAKGEILGVTGLLGSGYDDIPYLAFGARGIRSGTVSIDGGQPIDLADLTPKRAMGLKFALLPGDRQKEGGVGTLSVTENMFLPDLKRFYRRGRLDGRTMVREARSLSTAYQVYPPNPAMTLSMLSGGNAQKVLIARWMALDPSLLLLDEPTQGVDVGTQAQIFSVMRAAAARGMSVICASSDASQLAQLCDRVLVFARGKVSREIVGEAISKEGIAEACYAANEIVPEGRSQQR